MLFHLNDQASERNASSTVSLRCPSCRQQGTFDNLGRDIGFSPGDASYIELGQRSCPNPDCKAHVFVAIKLENNQRRLLVSYPAERIDFDVGSIPQSITKALEEALTCHANQCYIASAIMIRKTLEELCHEKGIQGPNLKDKIAKLGASVVLPQELLTGLDDLRLLGNDAAHIEAQVYKDVGQDEVELAIAVTKEVLKAVYQYADLIQRLKALKK